MSADWTDDYLVQIIPPGIAEKIGPGCTNLLRERARAALHEAEQRGRASADEFAAKCKADHAAYMKKLNEGAD